MSQFKAEFVKIKWVANLDCKWKWVAGDCYQELWIIDIEEGKADRVIKVTLVWVFRWKGVCKSEDFWIDRKIEKKWLGKQINRQKQWNGNYGARWTYPR